MAFKPPGPKTRPTIPKGTRYGWRGTWGTLDDGRSKLACLARRIAKELSEAYVVACPLDQRRLRLASEHLAWAEVTMLRLGKDRKGSATRKAALGHEGAADRLLAQLTARPKTLDLARAIQADLTRERDRQ